MQTASVATRLIGWLYAAFLAAATAAHGQGIPSFPSVVALEYSAGRILCSAVVLTDRLVLTAAHCVCAELPLNVFIGRTVFPEENAGLHWRADLKLEKPAFFSADFCSRYSTASAEAIRGNDLALLRFASPLLPGIQKILLRRGEPSDPSQSFARIFAVGWGESINFWRPGRKTLAELDLIARPCSSDDELNKDCKAGIELLAARPPHDTCFADSGGGLYGVKSDGTFYLLGITSRASSVTPNNMCGSGGIYTSVEAPVVRKWISSEISKAAANP
jgi:trypsin